MIHPLTEPRASAAAAGRRPRSRGGRRNPRLEISFSSLTSQVSPRRKRVTLRNKFTSRNIHTLTNHFKKYTYCLFDELLSSLPETLIHNNNNNNTDIKGLQGKEQQGEEEEVKKENVKKNKKMREREKCKKTYTGYY